MFANDPAVERPGAIVEASLDAPPAVGDTTLIESRFGDLEFRSENALMLPQRGPIRKFVALFKNFRW